MACDVQARAQNQVAAAAVFSDVLSKVSQHSGGTHNERVVEVLTELSCYEAAAARVLERRGVKRHSPCDDEDEKRCGPMATAVEEIV